MIDTLITPFQDFMFMRRALAGCIMIALSGTPLGVLLILRRMSLMGDAVAHAILPGIALGFIMAGLSVPIMSLGGVIAGLFVIFLTGLASRFTAIREDASLAAFYLMALACGVLLISCHGTALDLVHMLFGSVLAIDDAALILMAGVTTVTVLTLSLIYRPLVIESFDPNFMRAVRGRGGIYHILFLTLVVLNLVAGFQALGTLMAVGLMIVPAIAARFWTRHLFPMILVAEGIALVASYGGLVLSYRVNAPSGPAIILIAGAIYMMSLLFGRYDSIRARFFPFRHLRG